jgi:D-alanyl-D-alanine carboxypeptidase
MTLRVLIILSIVLLIVSSCRRAIDDTIKLDCTNAFNNPTHPKAILYQSIIDHYVEKGIPGISILIKDSDGVWCSSSGYADLEQKIPFTPCHISKGASITKLLVGTLTMMLQEDGVISLDDPIDQYIDKDILSKIDRSEGVTIRQLMNHTTGIYDVITSSDFYLAVLNNPNKEWTQEELLAFVYGQKGYELNTYPAHYSNTNTLLLSMCIEKATGRPHHKLLRERIFNPFGMNATFMQGREKIPNLAAQGYYDLHNNSSIVNVSNLITGSGNGYGGIYSNVFDFYYFIQALLVDKTIVSEASLNEMQTFVQEDDDFYTGYGIIKKFTKKSTFGIGHTGRDLGYSANLFYFPEKGYTMVFFVNYGTNGNSNLKQVFLEFENAITDNLISD